MVDGTIYVFLLGFALIAVGALPEGPVADAVLVAVLVLGLTAGQVAYFVVTQRRGGRSPGKFLTRIRVVDEHGRTPGTGALIRRSVPLVVEYFYVIAFAAMMRSPFRQRLGDRWGRTYVVRT